MVLCSPGGEVQLQLLLSIPNHNTHARTTSSFSIPKFRRHCRSFPIEMHVRSALTSISSRNSL